MWYLIVSFPDLCHLSYLIKYSTNRSTCIYAGMMAPYFKYTCVIVSLNTACFSRQILKSICLIQGGCTTFPIVSK